MKMGQASWCSIKVAMGRKNLKEKTICGEGTLPLERYSLLSLICQAHHPSS